MSINNIRLRASWHANECSLQINKTWETTTQLIILQIKTSWVSMKWSQPSLHAEIRALCLDLTWQLNLHLPLFPWLGNPLCAACVFSAPLVWFGHVCHSCGLLNPNSVHLENLPHTSLAVSDNPCILCTYTQTLKNGYTASQTYTIKHTQWICCGPHSLNYLTDAKLVKKSV